MKQKNKKLQYVLLGLVFLTWGMVIYNFVSWSGNDNYLASTEDYQLPVRNKDFEKPKEVFTLQLDWSDPFKVGKAGKTRKSNSSKPKSGTSSSSTKKYDRPKPPSRKGDKNIQKKAAFPKVAYKGYSINDEKITRVRISIEGKTQTMKLYEKNKELELVEMTKDSVVFSWRDERKSFLREKGY